MVGAETASDIYELTESGDLRPVIATRATEHTAETSPDGRWIAYVSDVGGREDVYVAPLSGEGNPWKVSVQGGYEPKWRPDGKELFYLAPGGRLVFDLNTEAEFAAWDDGDQVVHDGGGLLVYKHGASLAHLPDDVDDDHSSRATRFRTRSDPAGSQGPRAGRRR